MNVRKSIVRIFRTGMESDDDAVRLAMLLLLVMQLVVVGVLIWLLVN